MDVLNNQHWIDLYDTKFGNAIKSRLIWNQFKFDNIVCGKMNLHCIIHPIRDNIQEIRLKIEIDGNLRLKYDSR